MPGLIPFRIPSVLSFICIGAGIGILVFIKKEHKKLQSVILTQKQSIPYVVKKDTAQVLYNESVNVNNKCIEEKRFRMTIYAMRQCCYLNICRKRTVEKN